MELDVHLLIPEMILLAAACICTLLGLSSRDNIRKMTQRLAVVACAAALVCAVTTSPLFFDQTRHFNPNYITILACTIGLLSILAAWGMPSKADPSEPDANNRGEFYGMMLFSLAGVAMMGKVNDLVWLFVALELVSIPTYIMVATGRSQIVAQEAGVKYFFLGALAAAIFVFGFSYIYGATGSTRFHDIHFWFLENPHMSPLALIGLLMVIVGVAYKIAAVPLHFYTPDVYQGAATPVTAFLAFAPKAAGMVAIISILSLFDFDYSSADGRAVLMLLTVMSVLSMTVGNVLALLQRNIKRMLAYSSIAHSGYMLVGLVAMARNSTVGADGVSATIFYLTSYALMNLGAFAVLIYLQGKADAAEDLDDIAGLAKTHPLAAALLAICLFSLIGMPLTMGFLGKFYLIQQALLTGHATLAVIVMINAAIAAAYYLRIVAAMYLRESLFPASVRTGAPIKVAALVCTVAVVAFFIFPSIVLQANNTDTTKDPVLFTAVQLPPSPAPARGGAARGAAPGTRGQGASPAATASRPAAAP